MAPQILYRVLFSTTKPSLAQSSGLVIRPALLKGYTRHRVVDCDYPAITPDAGAESHQINGSPSNTSDACVRGTYVSGLTDVDVWRLDIFEGDQYKRVNISCNLLSASTSNGEMGSDGAETQLGEIVEAETYEWRDGSDKLEPREWDFEEFRREKIGRWIGVEEYSGESESPIWSSIPQQQQQQQSGRVRVFEVRPSIRGMFRPIFFTSMVHCAYRLLGSTHYLRSLPSR